MSREKIDLLRAYGAEVVVAPTDVPPDSPQSYYRVADRLTEEIPGRLPAQPVLQPGQPAGPLRVDRARAVGADRAAGSRTWWPASAPAARSPARPATCASASPSSSWSAPTPRARSTPGGAENVRPYLVEGVGEDFWPETFDPTVDRPLGHGLRPRRVPDHAPAGPARGDPRRRLGRPGAPRGARRSRPRSTTPRR